MLGPLFGKELLEIARRPGFFVMRTAMAGLVFLALAVYVWPRLEAIRIDNAAPRAVETARVGRTVYVYWSVGLAVVLAAVTPFFVAGAISSERDRGSLDLLLTTQLKDEEIVIGKWASRLLVLTLLVVVCIPMLAIGTIFGGFDLWDVLRGVLVQAVVVMTASSVALYYSAISQKPTTALLRTALVLAIWWCALPRLLPSIRANNTDVWSGLQWLKFMDLGRAFCPEAEYWLSRWWQPLDQSSTQLWTGARMFRPPWMVAAASDEYMRAVVKWFGQYGPLMLFLLAQAFLIALFLPRAFVALRKPPKLAATPWILRKAFAGYRCVVAAAKEFVNRLRERRGFAALWRAENWSEARWRHLLETRTSLNPLRYRNARANIFDPERLLLGWKTFTYVSLIGLFAALGAVGSSLIIESGGYRMFLLLTAGTAATALAVGSTAAIARERQYGSWDLIRLADFTPWQHLAANLTGLVGMLWPFATLAIAIAGLGVFMAVDSSGFGSMSLQQGTVLAALFLQLTATGLLISLASRTIGQALRRLVLAIAILTIVNPLLLKTFEEKWQLPATVAVLLAVLWCTRILSSGRRVWPAVFLIPLLVGSVLETVHLAKTPIPPHLANVDPSDVWGKQRLDNVRLSRGPGFSHDFVFAVMQSPYVWDYVDRFGPGDGSIGTRRYRFLLLTSLVTTLALFGMFLWFFPVLAEAQPKPKRAAGG